MYALVLASCVHYRWLHACTVTGSMHALSLVLCVQGKVGATAGHQAWGGAARRGRQAIQGVRAARAVLRALSCAVYSSSSDSFVCH